LEPLLYIIDPSKWTLSLAMATYTGTYATAWNLFMAADLIYILPMLLLFFFGQKFFMQGLGSMNSAGLK
jgi:multiple sugar transport system permease protein